MSVQGMEHRNPEIRTEKSDANPGAILRFLLWLIFGTVVVAIVLRWMFVTLSALEERKQPPPPIMKTASAEQAPPPQLQEHPSQDLATYREDQEKALHRYAWADKEKGIVQIDVDRAMKLTAERGLPVRSAEAVAPSPGPSAAPKAQRGPAK
jgi:hypothetical protein